MADIYNTDDMFDPEKLFENYTERNIPEFCMMGKQEQDYVRRIFYGGLLSAHLTLTQKVAEIPRNDALRLLSQFQIKLMEYISQYFANDKIDTEDE